MDYRWFSSFFKREGNVKRGSNHQKMQILIVREKSMSTFYKAESALCKLLYMPVDKHTHTEKNGID